MQTFPRLAVSLSVAVTLSVTGCTRDPAPGTEKAAAEGERLMRQMSDTLARARVLRFATSESLETPGLPSERHVLHFTRSVTVRRPDAMRFELKGTEGTNLDLAASYAGGTISLRDDVHGLWAQTAVPATLDAMLDDVARRFSFPVPFADVVYSVPYEAFVGPSTKGGFVGRETIDGVSCARLVVRRRPGRRASCGFPPRARPCRGAWSSPTSGLRARRRPASTSRTGTSRRRWRRRHSPSSRKTAPPRSRSSSSRRSSFPLAAMRVRRLRPTPRCRDDPVHAWRKTDESDLTFARNLRACGVRHGRRRHPGDPLRRGSS